MKRTERASLAKDTVAICDAGFYSTADKKRIDIKSTLDNAKKGTVLYSPENPPTNKISTEKHPTLLSTRNETAFQALDRLSKTRGSHIACLNFASARNPGGGFLNGSLAQEEALACASGLYPCLLEAPQYYERNRANRSALYLDLAIFSPGVPFFRNDAGHLLASPILASVITSPAPNAGAVATNEPHNTALVEPTLRRRAEQVLAIAAAHDIERLILGAWGCGVFRNDPKVVAKIFAELLKPPGKFAGVFQEVAFAVFDRSEDLGSYQAFCEHFRGGDT